MVDRHPGTVNTRATPNQVTEAAMCLNCGCGEPETRHKDTDITADDVRKASAGKPLDQTVQNMRTSLDKMGQSQGGQMASSMGQSGTGGQSER